jgi:hypothetical protein
MRLGSGSASLNFPRDGLIYSLLISKAFEQVEELKRRHVVLKFQAI